MKKHLLPITIAMLALFAVPVLAGEGQLSPGLDVLAARNDMVLTAVRYTAHVFSAEDFRNVLGETVDRITVLTVPARSEGALLLGRSDVQPGQVIPLAEAPQLSFEPTDDSLSAVSFTFTADGQYETVCTLRFTESVNSAPAAVGKEVSVWTQAGVSESGVLAPFSDPDGDDIRYEIVSYPAHGTVRLTDTARGEYVYTPEAEYVGDDLFTYRVRDGFGHYSTVRTAAVSAVTPLTDVTPADVPDGDGMNAVRVMIAKGIMDCRVVGGSVLFDPKGPVSREDFLVDVLRLFGTGTAATCEKTVFADDGAISAAAKPYVAAAYRLSLVTGWEDGGQLLFRPDDAITRAEAAAILTRVIGQEADTAVPTFADDGELPLWAKNAVYVMREWGILMPDAEGRFGADEVLSRREEAKALLRLMRLTGRL